MATTTGRTTDTLVRWRDGRAYGFTAGDTFIHQSDCPDGVPIAPGTVISFIVAATPKGRRGFDVRVEAYEYDE